MDPPFEVKPFGKMSAKEAKKHFEWYVSEVPNRINLLIDLFGATGGGEKKYLDLSPKSLIILWEWFLPNIKTTLKTKEEIDNELQNIPDWLKDEVRRNNKKLSVASTTLAMDIAIYFAETLIKHFEKNLKWGYITKPKSLEYVNSPVLVGFKSDMELNPRTVVYNLTLDAIDGNTSKEALYQLFKVWLEYI